MGDNIGGTVPSVSRNLDVDDDPRVLASGARGFDAELGRELGQGLLTVLVASASPPFGEAVTGVGLATCFFCLGVDGVFFLIDEFFLAWTCAYCEEVTVMGLVVLV